jgi:hypothetical protein
MSPRVKMRHMPGRITTGAFMLNSGVSKLHPDEATVGMLHGMASGAYPFLRSMPPRRFVSLLSASEIVLGAALLLPVVPTVLVAAGLTAFSAGLVGLYLRTPGMRQEGSLRPTPQGLVLSKDIWMLGIGLGLFVDELTEGELVEDDTD